MRLLFIIFLFSISPLFAQDAIYWENLPGGKFKLTMTAKHPGTVYGTQVVLQAKATYYNQALTLMGEAVSEPVTMTVGQSVWKRQWLVSSEFLRDPWFISGVGGLIHQNEGLLLWVNCPNDGQEHSIVWGFKCPDREALQVAGQ